MRKSCLNWVPVNVPNGLVVFLRSAQRSVEEPRLPQFARLSSPAIDQDCRASFDGLHGKGDREWTHRCEDGVPMIGKEYPCGQPEGVHYAHPVDGHGELMEIVVRQVGAALDEAYGDKEVSVGKEGTTEP